MFVTTSFYCFYLQECNLSLLLTILFFSLYLATVMDAEVVHCPIRPPVWSQAGDLYAHVPKHLTLFKTTFLCFFFFFLSVEYCSCFFFWFSPYWRTEFENTKNSSLTYMALSVLRLIPVGYQFATTVIPKTPLGCVEKVYWSYKRITISYGLFFCSEDDLPVICLSM